MSLSGEEDWVGTTRSGVVSLAAGSLTLAPAFFFGLKVADLVAAVDFSLRLSGPGVFLVAVTLGCVGASVTG